MFQESGMSMERIFSFFSPGEDTNEINEEDFSAGLRSLNSDYFNLTAVSRVDKGSELKAVIQN
jgi:hypothetical protein